MKNNVTVTVNWTQITVVVLVGIILAGFIIGFPCGCGKQDTAEPTPVVPTVNPVVEVTEGQDAVHTPEAIPATPEPTPTPPIVLVPNDDVVEEIVEEEPEPTPTPALTPTPTPEPTPTPATAQTEQAYNGWPAIPEWQLPQPDKPSGDTVIVIPSGQQTSRDTVGILPNQNVVIVPNTHTASDPSSHDWLAEEIFLLTNKERVAGGLNELGYAYDLQSVADTRARESAEKFSHTRPNGRSYDSMITKDCKVTGENLILADKPIATPDNLVSEWMNSPGHRYNILLPDYTGLAVGIYETNGVLYASQIFIG